MRDLRHARDAVAEWKAGPRVQHEELERGKREEITHEQLTLCRDTDRGLAPTPQSCGPRWSASASRPRNPGARNVRDRRPARIPPARVREPLPPLFRCD